MNCKALHITLMMLVLSSIGFAQVMQPSARASRSEIKIGEQVVLDLSIEYRLQGETPKIEFPSFADTIVTGVEVLESTPVITSQPDSTKDPSLYKVQQQLTLTSFDSGYYEIGNLPITVNGQIMNTNRLALAVQTVQVDTTQMAIRDIKDIRAVSLSALDYLKIYWWVVLIFVVIGLLIGGYFWVKKRMRERPNIPVEPAAPVIPPHIIAAQALEALKEKKLWQEGKIKLYHTELTDILREYIEQRFQVMAHEQTSDEILSGLKFVLTDAEAMIRLRKSLKTADLVKFAKHKPGFNENEMSLSYAQEFVSLTTEKEVQKGNE